MSIRYWIDLEDATGARVGDGPLINVGAWTHTAQLDRAGTFSFTLAATDPRAAQVRVKRIARCWSIEGGVLRAHGAGIIDTIETTIGPDAAPLLVVSGDDLLRELAYRSVDELAIVQESWEHPAEVWTEEGGSIDRLYEAYDLLIGDVTTSVTFRVGQGLQNRVMYITNAVPFTAVRFGLTAAVNNNALTMGYSYYNAEAANWQALTVTDSTDVGGAPFGQTGTVDWETAPAGWGPDSTGRYVIKVSSASPQTDDTGCYDLAVLVRRPDPAALSKIVALAPAGWSLDLVNGYESIQDATLSGTELVVNGAFDSDVSDWTTQYVPAEGTVAWDANGYTGGGVLATNTTGSAASPRAYQDITVAANTDYVLSAYAKGDAGTEAGYIVCEKTDGTDIAPILYGPVEAAWAACKQNITIPSGMTTLRLRFSAPYGATGAAAFDTISLQALIAGGEAMTTFAGETVLGALIWLAEQVGEHFVLSPNGREICWLRSDAPDSGLRAIAADGSAENDNICLITELAEIHDAYDCSTRVRAYGGGVGAARVDLTSCTRSAPAGYVLDKTTGWLVCTAAETALGRIERILDYPEINALDTTPAQMAFAANQVFDRAYNYLRTHTATETDRAAAGYDVPRAYRLTVTKLNRPLLPGYRLRIVYRRVVGAYVAIDINQEVYVLSSTVQVDASGARTVALEVSTIYAPLVSEAEYVMRRLAAAQAARAHSIAEGGLNNVDLGAPTQLAVRDGRIVGITR